MKHSPGEEIPDPKRVFKCSWTFHYISRDILWPFENNFDISLLAAAEALDEQMMWLESTGIKPKAAANSDLIMAYGTIFKVNI
jgi:hypothetical protein